MPGFDVPVSTLDADWTGDGSWAWPLGGDGSIGALGTLLIQDLDGYTIAALDAIQGAYDSFVQAVRAEPGVLSERGRDQIAAMSPPLASELTLTLDDRRAVFSPTSIGSPLYGQADIGVPVRWRLAWRGLTAGVMRGRAVEWAPRAGVGDQAVEVRVLSQLARLVGRRGVSSVLYGTGVAATGPRTDECLGYVLDAAGLTDPALRSFGVGATRVNWFWISPDDDLFDLVVKLWAAEGPGARVWDDGSGVTRFMGRNDQYTLSSSTDVQATFVDVDDGVTAWYTAVQSEAGDRSIVNRAAMTVTRRVVDASDAVLWTYGQALTMAANESRLVWVAPAGSDPIASTVPMSPGIDYTVTAGAVNTASVVAPFTGVRVALRLIAGPAGVTLTGLQVRGRLARAVGATQVSDSGIDAAASRARWGDRAINVPAWPELDPPVAQDLVNACVLLYRNPRPIDRVTVPLAVAPNVYAAQTREIGHRVTILNRRTGAARSSWIESIATRHTGGAPEVVLGCEQAVATSAARWDSGRWGTDAWGF